MEKIKVIQSDNPIEFENKVNEFITTSTGKNVITNHLIKPVGTNDKVTHVAIFYYIDKEEYNKIIRQLDKEQMVQGSQAGIVKANGGKKKTYKLN